MNLYRRLFVIVVLVTLAVLVTPVGTVFAATVPTYSNGGAPQPPPAPIVVPDTNPYPLPEPKPILSTTMGGSADAGGKTFDWWTSNNCELTLTSVGAGAKIETDGACIGYATLSLPLPDGADYTKCTFYKDGVAQTGGAYLATDGRVYAFVYAPPTPDGTWTVSCSE